jgi:hypothetical protein
MPRAIDKHSTGGVGDKVSMLLAPVIAACGLPVAKLTARGLGHTGGTADKLESIPGLVLDMDRDRCLRLLEQTGIAFGVPSASIAPADRRLYGLRNLTATVDCLPLVASSVLAKKLALGARWLVFDVKTGDGAFFSRLEDSVALAELLVNTAGELGRHAVAVVSDMSQPLGFWAGHACEVREVVEVLREGKGDARLLEVTTTLAAQVAAIAGIRARRRARSGRARPARHGSSAARAAAQGRTPAPRPAAGLRSRRSSCGGGSVDFGTAARRWRRGARLPLLEAGGGRKTAGRTDRSGHQPVVPRPPGIASKPVRAGAPRCSRAARVRATPRAASAVEAEGRPAGGPSRHPRRPRRQSDRTRRQ